MSKASGGGGRKGGGRTGGGGGMGSLSNPASRASLVQGLEQRIAKNERQARGYENNLRGLTADGKQKLRPLRSSTLDDYRQRIRNLRRDSDASRADIERIRRGAGG